MTSPSNTTYDKKLRYQGVLENPWVSKIQRNMLDAGKVTGFCKAVRDVQFQSVLDVGCGLGEYTAANKGFYVGMDNSFSRACFARDHTSENFTVGSAFELPFKNKSFDAAFLINTSHHFSGDEFLQALGELKRVAKRYIVVSDSVVTENQNWVSSFFYSLDRGGCFRSGDGMKAIFEEADGVTLDFEETFRTFPGLYVHTTFVLKISD